MKKIKYLTIIKLPGIDLSQNELNGFGSDGFELCTVIHDNVTQCDTYVFKREYESTDGLITS